MRLYFYKNKQNIYIYIFFGKNKQNILIKTSSYKTRLNSSKDIEKMNLSFFLCGAKEHIPQESLVYQSICKNPLAEYNLLVREKYMYNKVLYGFSKRHGKKIFRYRLRFCEILTLKYNVILKWIFIFPFNI
jgi:hypothetical protein